MKYSYYPGCTLKTKAKDLDLYAHKSAEALGVELVEVKTIKPTPKPVSNMVVPNKGIVKEKVAPQGRDAQKPTIIPVQQK